MQATVQTVSSESKVTKSGKTYYRIQADGNWLSVYKRFNVGDVIEYEQGNLPDWPRNVHLADGKTTGDYSPSAPLGKDPATPSGQFGRVEYTALLKTIVEIAEVAGITDHQAIAALNNTLLISLQKQGVKINVSSFMGGTPF